MTAHLEVPPMQSALNCVVSSGPQKMQKLSQHLMRLSADKDKCITTMEAEMEEMRQVLVHAMEENDCLRAKLHQMQSEFPQKQQREREIRNLLSTMTNIMEGHQDPNPCDFNACDPCAPRFDPPAPSQCTSNAPAQCVPSRAPSRGMYQKQQHEGQMNTKQTQSWCPPQKRDNCGTEVLSPQAQSEHCDAVQGSWQDRFLQYKGSNPGY